MGIDSLRTRIVWLTVFFAAFVFADTGAATLYGAAHTGAGSASTLYRIDSTSGAATVVGPIGFDNVGGIDFHPDGRLFGVAKRSGPAVWVLIRIDPNTGAGTEVGVLVNTAASSGGGGHHDVSFRTDGVLYLTARSPINPCVSLFTVDLATGLATEVGDTGVCSSGNALVFSPADGLRHANTDGGGTLYTVDQISGASGAPSVALSYVGFPTLTAPKPNAMDIDPDSAIRFVSVNDGTAGAGPNYLATLDPVTGNVTHIGPTVNGLDALAWQPSACVVSLYGAAHTGGPGSPSTLYRVNPSDGIALPVGPIGFDRVTGMEFHPESGILFGIAQRPSDGTSVLIRINPITGIGSEVGPFVNTINGGGHFGLSFRGSDSALFLMAFSPVGPCVSLFSVDVDTGLATELGDTTTCGTGNALGFSWDDTLYHTNQDSSGTLYTVDPGTGISTSTGLLMTFSGFPPLVDARTNGMDFNPANGISFVAINDGSGGAGPNYLAKLDPATGIISHIGRSVSGLNALAWRADCNDFNACTDDPCKHCDVSAGPCAPSCALFGTAHAGKDGLATLYRIDAASGVATPVGPIGFERVGSIDFDSRGTLYGVGERTDGSDTTVLIRIDPTTGAGTEVGGLVTSFSGGGHFDVSFRNTDDVLHLLAFSRVFGGVSLFTIDTITGFANEIGDTTVLANGNALAFSPTDALRHATNDVGGTIYTVDQVSGASGAPDDPLTYVGFPALTDPRPSAMDFDPCSGVAYAAINDSTGGGGPNYLATVDTSNGNVSHVGRSVDGLDGLAFYRSEAVCCHVPLAGPVLLRNPLLATSETRFEWYDVPQDVVMVRGDLAALDTYGTLAVTPLTMATSFVDASVPSLGEGFYYVVRGACSVASWSSGGFGECAAGPFACPPGGRDGNLP